MKETNLNDNVNKNDNLQENKGIEIKPIKEKKTIHGEFFVAFASILLIYVAYIFVFQQMRPFFFFHQLSSLFFIL